MLMPGDQSLPEFNRTLSGGVDEIRKRHFDKWPFFVVGAIILILVSLWILTILLSNNLISIEDQSFMNDQPFGESAVIINKVVLNEPGFVVVRILKFFPSQNVNRPIIGLSKFLERGTYKDVVLVLSDPTLNRVDLQEEFRVGDRIQATIYEDDGDGIFNETLDKPAILFLGKKIQDTVTLR